MFKDICAIKSVHTANGGLKGFAYRHLAEYFFTSNKDGATREISFEEYRNLH